MTASIGIAIIGETSPEAALRDLPTCDVSRSKANGRARAHRLADALSEASGPRRAPRRSASRATPSTTASRSESVPTRVPDRFRQAHRLQGPGAFAAHPSRAPRTGRASFRSPKRPGSSAASASGSSRPRSTKPSASARPHILSGLASAWAWASPPMNSAMPASRPGPPKRSKLPASTRHSWSSRSPRPPSSARPTPATTLHRSCGASVSTCARRLPAPGIPRSCTSSASRWDGQKLDQSAIVHGLTQSHARPGAIVASLPSLAHDPRRLRDRREGVETPEQAPPADAQSGCRNAGQGRCWAPASPAPPTSTPHLATVQPTTGP